MPRVLHPVVEAVTGAATHPKYQGERRSMQSRRQFLTALSVSFLFAGCGGSSDKVSAPPPSPEVKAAADAMQAEMLKKMNKRR